MDCSMETWDSKDHVQTQTFYYVGKDYDRASYENNVFYSQDFTEDLEDVSSRTIAAFEFAVSIPSWDFLARPNSSCYVHKDNLVKHCELLPREHTIRGVLSGGENPFLWGGCHYIFSRDVVENMVANKDKWNHDIMDDNSITNLLKEIGYTLDSTGWCASINMQPDGSYLCLTYNHGSNFTFTDFADIGDKLDGHFFVRCKQDLRRHEDLRIFRELHKHWK